jgi:hypothetical protein
MKVTKFIIQESKLNKGLFILIAICEDGTEWVVNETASQRGTFGCIPTSESSDTI